MERYGLLGFPLSHSFSKGFFSDKFDTLGINANYQNIEIAPQNLSSIRDYIAEQPDLCGLNVTIPYKQSIVPFLDELDETAKAVGAVNVIKIERRPEGLHLTGYNTDCIAFEKSLCPLLHSSHRSAYVLGTGGASKAVCYVLQKLGIKFTPVSRQDAPGLLTYSEITPDLLSRTSLVINTTPLGMYPNVNEQPSLPYQAVTAAHLFYDLVYNPEMTRFLFHAHRHGAETKNGLEMLNLQAEASWDIWQAND